MSYLVPADGEAYRPPSDIHIYVLLEGGMKRNNLLVQALGLHHPISAQRDAVTKTFFCGGLGLHLSTNDIPDTHSVNVLLSTIVSMDEFQISIT